MSLWDHLNQLAGSGVAQPDSRSTNSTEGLMETAASWAHSAGAFLGGTRQWVEGQAIAKHPATTLGIAFGLGVFTGWLVKRR